MSDKTCKTCRWWIESEDKEIRNILNARKCTSPKVVFGDYKDVDDNFVDSIIVDNKTETPLPPDAAAVLDGSGYFAALMPGPDFGCIHHEEKS